MQKWLKKNDDLRAAYDKLSQMSADEQKREEYEARQKAIWDHNTLVNYANYAREEGAASERVNTERERQRANEAEERQAEAERRLAEAEQENARLRAALQAQNPGES